MILNSVLSDCTTNMLQAQTATKTGTAFFSTAVPVDLQVQENILKMY